MIGKLFKRIKDWWDGGKPHNEQENYSCENLSYKEIIELKTKLKPSSSISAQAVLDIFEKFEKYYDAKLNND